MKLNIIFMSLFFWCFLVAFKPHGGHYAIFNYQITSEQINLEFKIENTVLDHFSMKEKCAYYETATALCLMEYINQNSMLKIGGESIKFELQNSHKGEQVFNLNLVAKGTFDVSEELTVNNKCFIEFDPKFENRVIIQEDDFFKSYRLNRQHQTINVKIIH